jgi:hypothetical protein
MSFDPYDYYLKVQKSIKIPIPKMGTQLGCGDSFPHTFLHSRKHEMWLSGFTFGPHLCKPLPMLQAQG